MSDSYGGGAGFGAMDGSDGAQFGGGPESGPQTLAAPDAPQQPQAQGPQPDAGPSFGEGLQKFGEGLKSMLPGPHYKQPDPQTSPLDQASDLLTQRVKRANDIATNPLAQFFAPDKVAAARQFVPQATEQLQKIEQQKSQIQAGRVEARTLGLDPGDVSDQASQADRMTVATGKALEGNMKAFQGIMAVDPTRAAAIAPQVYEVVSGNLSKAQFAFDSLSSMQNPGQYAAKVREMRADGSLGSLEKLGLKVPPTFDQFNASKALEGKSLREARMGINKISQDLEARNTYQPMEEKEAKTYAGRLTTVAGDAIGAGTWSRNGASGTRGLVINGLGVPEDLGKGGVLGTAEQRKELGESFRNAVPKEEIEKFRSFTRTYDLATKDKNGNRLPEGKINENPNVQQGIAEGLASMLRGGHGGANVGLLNIETSKRGYMQALFDRISTEKAGVLNTISGKDLRPYLTQLTASQMRDVMDVLKGANDASLDDRAKDIARRAGALGFGVDALGLGKDETSGAVGAALEQGRQAQIARMRQGFQAIGGGDGVLQLGAQRPGAGAAGLPQGGQNANQLPGADPLQTPVQQATNQPAPQPQPQGTQPPAAPAPTQPNTPAAGATPPGPSSAPAGPGGSPRPSTPPQTYERRDLPSLGPDGQPTSPGGAQSVRVASADVNVPPLPAGATPNYIRAAQRIESGNEKDPWKAGNDRSSAKGAFQFINGTWQASKPPGAPDDPRQATPQQQTEAMATLTAKNAKSLQVNNLPVNDRNLYMAHNVGAGGAAALLKADPNADARSVVGEAAAKNNPLFFKGRPTVATVLARYQSEMDKGSQDAGDDGPQPRTPGGGATAAIPGIVSRAAVQAIPGGAGAMAVWDMLTPAQRDKIKDVAIDNAPAIGGTVGAVAGGVSPVPGGTIMGGAAGGAAGQAFKDYMQGREQSPQRIGKEALLSGVLSVGGPVARPVVSAVGRAVGAGAVEAGDKALQGGDAADIVEAGAGGAAMAAGGEAFGRSLGMGLHKLYTLFTPSAQSAVRAAAKDLSEAGEILKKEPNRIPGPGGTEIPNPKYIDAESQYGKAETKLKELMPNAKPEEVAYAHQVSSESVPRSKQEAIVEKPAALERERVGQGYRQIENEVASHGVGAVKGTPRLPDGPMAAVAAKKVAAEHADLAERTEMAITAPAPDWRTKWEQLKTARTELLDAERDALSSTAKGKSLEAKDMRTLADTVRAQQEKAAEYVFGKAEGQKVMERLKMLDVRYRRLMENTNGGDIVGAARLTGEAGREAERRFIAFAGDDAAAIQAYKMLRRAGSNVEKDVLKTIQLERVPVVGQAYGVLKYMAGFNQWMRERAAGSPVKFEDVLNSVPDTSAKQIRDIFGQAGARAAVQ